jgi:UDPglucose 6-dehydrogenase
MRITVVGSGYVGLVAGACFADLGHEVIIVDNDQQKLAALKVGVVPIHEPFLPELLQRHRGRRLKFSGDLQEAVRASLAVFIAVGTPPTQGGEAELSYVESVNSHRLHVEALTGHAVSMSAEEFVVSGRSITADNIYLKIGIPEESSQVMQKIEQARIVLVNFAGAMVP